MSLLFETAHIETDQEETLGIVNQKLVTVSVPRGDFTLPRDFPFRPVPDPHLDYFAFACLFQLQHEDIVGFVGKASFDKLFPRVEGFSAVHMQAIPFNLLRTLWCEQGFFIKTSKFIHCGEHYLTNRNDVWSVESAAEMVPQVGDLFVAYYLPLGT